MENTDYKEIKVWYVYEKNSNDIVIFYNKLDADLFVSSDKIDFIEHKSVWLLQEDIDKLKNGESIFL